jgi:formylmethanofuran dehydrogenase subunit E
MTVITRPTDLWAFDTRLEEAVRFHGHMCPGQVLGVRMAVAGCRAIGIDDPKRAGKRLVVFAEIDRCAIDAIQSVTGVSLGKRTLKHMDFGKMAATFVDVEHGLARRVVARDDARVHAPQWAPGVTGERTIQIEAYRVMPEETLLTITPVEVLPGWLDRRRVRVFCDVCGEGINYERELHIARLTVCRPCAGQGYLRA